MEHDATGMGDDYHANHAHQTHSMMECFLRSPEEYAAKYVTHTIAPSPPTPQMRLGSLTHCLLLQPHEFDRQYIVEPRFDRRTNKGKEEYAAWQERAGSLARITAEERSIAESMAGAVRNDEFASTYLAKAGDYERPIAWTDPETGLACKCKPDKLIVDFDCDRPIVFDLKSAADPSPEEFSKAIYNRGYHRQMAHYCQGVHLELNGDWPEAVLCAVRNSPPYEVYTYKLDELFMAIGARDNAEILAKIQRCQETGRWWHPLQKQLVVATPPAWVVRGMAAA